MALTKEQSISQYGTEAYTGWQPLEASNDAREHPEKLNTYRADTSTQTAEQSADAILKASQEEVKQEIGYLDKYTTENPFVFDEEFARQAETQTFEPYYATLLDEYTRDINLKKENVQDEQKLLQDLYRLDSATRSRAYEKGVRSAAEGYAGKGLFFSGDRLRDAGERSVEYLSAEERAKLNLEGQQRGLGRQGEALNIEEEVKQRQLKEQKAEAISGGIETRRKEAEVGYYTPLVQSYYRRFPTTSGNTLAGYVQPDYLRY